MEYNTSSGDFSGNDIKRVPEWIVKMGMEYFPRLGVGGSLTAKYTGERLNDNENTIREDDFWVVDASICYAFETMTLTLFANNVLDEQYAELRSADTYYPADPFNVTLSCSFNL